MGGYFDQIEMTTVASILLLLPQVVDTDTFKVTFTNGSNHDRSSLLLKKKRRGGNSYYLNSISGLAEPLKFSH